MTNKLTQEQQEVLRANTIVALSTSLHDQPRSVFVELNKILEDKLILTDNQMQITRDNLLQNPQVCVLATAPGYSLFLLIQGTATYYTEGEYFDYVKDLPSNAGYVPKGAVVIDIINVIEGK